MATYNVTCKIIRGSQGDIEQKIQSYINSIDNTKVVRAIGVTQYGAGDNLMVIIIHDA